MKNPSWCNNCEECNLIYHHCYVPYIDSNDEYCEYCNVEEYRFNNDEGYRLKIVGIALTDACHELSILKGKPQFASDFIEEARRRNAKD